VRGKLLSGLLFTLLLLIASIPLQGMAFLFGGVELPELLVSNLMLLVTAILFSAIGIYTSSWMKRSIPATILAYVIANSSLILIPLLVWIISIFFPSFIDIIDFSSDDSPLLIIFGLSLLWLLISSNPIFAGIISEVFLLDENVVFFYTTDITKNFTAHLPSPWITFTLLNLFLAWLFYRGAIRRVAQRDKE
jgi:ABC-2 type transport system permease protein